MRSLEVRDSFEAIGTHWEIVLNNIADNQNPAFLFALIKKRIAEYDKNYSRFRSDSLIAEMAHTAGDYSLPADAKPLFDLYQELYKQTGGLVTPLIGQALVDAGYDAKYSLRPGIIKETPLWDEVIEYHFPRLTIKKPVLIDVGAAGKGHCIDIVGELLESQGVVVYTVDAGGDIRTRGPANSTQKIGLENPFDTTEAIGVVELANRSICGSAGNRRAWQGFNHIMHPKNKVSVEDIAATWVVADTTLVADGLSTALFFAKPEKLKGDFDFEYLIVRKDSTYDISSAFPGQVFAS